MNLGKSIRDSTKLAKTILAIASALETIRREDPDALCGRLLLCILLSFILRIIFI